jgi:hypothetical protein
VPSHRPLTQKKKFGCYPRHKRRWGTREQVTRSSSSLVFAVHLAGDLPNSSHLKKKDQSHPDSGRSSARKLAVGGVKKCEFDRPNLAA